MKKIMFNDKYGLTQAVLEGRKTMTRRMVPLSLYNQTDWKAVEEGNYMAYIDGDGYYHDVRFCGNYGIGDEVAVAQAYKGLNYNFHGFATNPSRSCGIKKEYAKKHKGWSNKMFVEAKFMPHHIRIADIKVERLQDISDEDCMKEGIGSWESPYYIMPCYHLPITSNAMRYYNTPREAFLALINKVSGKGTWESNPWVFAYDFELID